MANIIGNLMGHTLRRIIEEVIWFWIRSKTKERALNLDNLGIRGILRPYGWVHESLGLYVG